MKLSKKNFYGVSKWLLMIVCFAVLSCRVSMVYAVVDDPLEEALTGVEVAETAVEDVEAGEGDVTAGLEEGEDVDQETTLKDVAANTSETAAASQTLVAQGVAKNTWDTVTQIAKIAAFLGEAMAATVVFFGMMAESFQLGEWGLGASDDAAHLVHTNSVGEPDTLQAQLTNYVSMSAPVKVKDLNSDLNKNKATQKPVLEYSSTSAMSLMGGHRQYSPEHQQAANNFVYNSSGAGVGIAKPAIVVHPTREHISYNANFNLTAANQSHSSSALSTVYAGGVTPTDSNGNPLKDKDKNPINKSSMSQAFDVLTFQTCIPTDSKDIKNNFIVQLGCMVMNVGALVPAGLYVFTSLGRLTSGVTAGLSSMVTAGFQKGFLDPSKSQADISQIGADTNSTKK